MILAQKRTSLLQQPEYDSEIRRRVHFVLVSEKGRLDVVICNFFYWTWSGAHLLDNFVEGKLEPVYAFHPHRKIWKDKEPRLCPITVLNIL